MTHTRVILGMQGVQMPANVIRGIGRWSTEFMLALLKFHPELVGGVSFDDQLPLPPFISALPPDVPIFRGDAAPPDAHGGGVVFHALSVLEDLSIGSVWPRWARNPSVGLVTTMYDMIPMLFPDDYFKGSLKRLLEVRYEMHRQADAVIAISRTTADDTRRLLGIDHDKVVVASGGVSERFRPPSDAEPSSALAAHGVRPGFLLTIGNVDPRKNLFGLMAAYAALPNEVRHEHQLVLTCSQAGDAHLLHLAGECERLGIGADVVLMSFVSDDVMVSLYQECCLMVYPSLYEGLGLPLIEALACGAAVLASDVGPMREIVTAEEGLFDPHDVGSIERSLLRAISSPDVLKSLREAAALAAARYTWQQSIEHTVHAYALASRP